MMFSLALKKEQFTAIIHYAILSMLSSQLMNKKEVAPLLEQTLKCIKKKLNVLFLRFIFAFYFSGEFYTNLPDFFCV